MDEPTGSPSLADLMILADSILDQCLAGARDAIKNNPDDDPVVVVFKQMLTGLGRDPIILIFTISHLAVRLIKAEGALGATS